MDTSAPWGRFRPNAVEAALLHTARALPAVPPFGALALLLRRPLKYGTHDPLDVRLWDLRLRLARRDSLSESRMLFTPQLFDRRERAAVIERLRHGDTFVDAGANVGGYSFWVYHHLRQHARIIAVEPDPDLAARIRFNIDSNDAHSIELHQVALSDQPGEALLHISPLNRGENTLLDDARANGPAVRVPVVTLLGLLNSCAVDNVTVLKIDIEGMEHRVLSHFFAHAPPRLHPASLLLEMKDRPEYRALLDLLTGLGYRTALQTGRNIVMDRVPR